ncbi:uncharacterized protein LOC143033643 [Oratosquilla oratoria]|uniref:uncharacterized protein LOC143033643 n=1 Tax=Oratosquilla oratoria TaxID=337810 RepID=UPI003F76C0C5
MKFTLVWLLLVAVISASALPNPEATADAGAEGEAEPWNIYGSRGIHRNYGYGSRFGLGYGHSYNRYNHGIGYGHGGHTGVSRVVRPVVQRVVTVQRVVQPSYTGYGGGLYGGSGYGAGGYGNRW